MILNRETQVGMLGHVYSTLVSTGEQIVTVAIIGLLKRDALSLHLPRRVIL